MRTARKRPRRARASIGFAVAILALTAIGAGYEAFVVLVMGRAYRSDHALQLPDPPLFGTIHAATFSLPRPIGSDIPDPASYQLASLDTREVDVTGSISDRAVTDRWDAEAFPNLPTINRDSKGDRLDRIATQRGDKLVQGAPPKGTDALAKADRLVPAHTPRLASKPEAGHGGSREEAREVAAVTVDQTPAAPASPGTSAQTPNIELANARPDAVARAETAKSQPDWATIPALPNATVQTARLYFGVEMDDAHARLEPWGLGEEPVVAAPNASPSEIGDSGGAKSKVGTTAESIAPKGQVTGAEQRPKSPAELLGLTGKAREKAEKCLANAVYFEARAEPVRGQIAVAQVVMNRVFSGYYPNDVCGVVYQNANRRSACQFTFACDGIPDVVNEPDAWVRAKQIASDTLDGKLWLPEIGKATHYHAYWVRPSWVHEMIRLNKIGVHTFYRPLNWGNGSDAPEWGDAATTAEEAKKL
jgi:spore germination cell wall hydrolase CwlJ-like protein